MSWKRFKELFQNRKPDESHFTLGIDIGQDSSALAFYNAISGSTELLDMSGGYGRPSVPTVVQYLTESKEWVFGEYAVLNKGVGRDVTLASFMDKLGQKEDWDLDGRSVSLVNVLGLYLKELIGGLKNINPKAEVAGAVAAVPSYASAEFREELTRAFQAAGFGKELIRLATDRECVLTYYLTREKPRSESVLLLDYGSRALRGGVYQIQPEKDRIAVKAQSFLFSDALGAKRIDEKLMALFLSYFPPKAPRREKEQLEAFLFQHKDLLLQKSDWQKPVKLYFNFTYPPIQRTVTQAQMKELTGPFRLAFDQFIFDLRAQNASAGQLSGQLSEQAPGGQIDTVVCTGGGFEMHWAKEAAREHFPASRLIFYKNAKSAAAEGAALLAACHLGVVDAPAIQIEDHLLIQEDIGLLLHKKKFYPMIQSASFWWRRCPDVYFIFNEAVAAAGRGVSVPLIQRGADGVFRVIADIGPLHLPDRPKGATRLSLSLQ
ncbi:MAG: hypothetical protein LBT44_00180, partial [Clostridiales bacterium]|nr:hypothetical protein [Clostridiales bacterium]